MFPDTYCSKRLPGQEPCKQLLKPENIFKKSENSINMLLQNVIIRN